MKQTLLDMTQEILSAMSSDEVNSISDTTESLQVAAIVKRSYLDIISRGHIPEHNQLIQLNPSLDTTRPVLMYVPDQVNKIEWIKYFDTTVSDGVVNGYVYVTMVPIAQFIDMTNGYNPTDSNVDSFTLNETINDIPGGGYTFYYKNDQQPRFCTFISDHYIIFDSYDVTQDDTLQTSKTMCFGQVAPIFKMEDSFIPDLDDKQFSLLVNSAKALAFYELKQMPHQKAEQEVKRQWSSVQKNKSINDIPSSFDKLPDFGRRGSMSFNRRWWDGTRQR